MLELVIGMIWNILPKTSDPDRMARRVKIVTIPSFMLNWICRQVPADSFYTNFWEHRVRVGHVNFWSHLSNSIPIWSDLISIFALWDQTDGNVSLSIHLWSQKDLILFKGMYISYRRLFYTQGSGQTCRLLIPILWPDPNFYPKINQIHNRCDPNSQLSLHDILNYTGVIILKYSKKKMYSTNFWCGASQQF